MEAAEAAADEAMEAIDAAAAAAEAMVALERHPDEPLVVSDDDAPESLKELKTFKPAKGTLLGLMGLPAAGKSTLCEKLMDVKTHNIKIVRFDDDLEATGAFEQWAPEKYHQARAISLQRVAGLLEESSASIIIADDNNHLRSMRHALFRLARDAGWAYATIRLECSQEVAEARNSTREGRERVPAETITQMAQDLEPPDPLRMGWERFAVTVGSDQVAEVLAAADRARQAGPPVLPEDLEVLEERAREARERTLASKKHALDLALRACVGDVASACAESLKKKDRATLGKALAAARKDVLAVSEQAKALDAPRCLELFAAYALGRVALGEGSLPEDDVKSVREALSAAVSKQIYRGDLSLHEPPPVPSEDNCFPPQPLECAPPLIFEKVLEDCDLSKEGFVDRMRGAILEIEASLADAPAPAEAEAPAPAPGVPRIAEVED